MANERAKVGKETKLAWIAIAISVIALAVAIFGAGCGKKRHPMMGVGGMQRPGMEQRGDVRRLGNPSERGQEPMGGARKAGNENREMPKPGQKPEQKPQPKGE